MKSNPHVVFGILVYQYTKIIVHKNEMSTVFRGFWNCNFLGNLTDIIIILLRNCLRLTSSNNLFSRNY